MVKRRRATPRRRGPKSFGILNAVEGLFQANVLTQYAFKTDALSFVFGEAVPGFSSAGGISLTELVKSPQRLGGVVAERVSNPNLAIKAALTSAFGNAAFRVGRRFLRRPISQINTKIMNPLALGVKL